MTELRKRLNSSMTYEEYLHTFDQPPRKPSLKPKQDPVAEIDELDLLIDAPTLESFPIKQHYKPKLIIQEESEDFQTLPTCDTIPSVQSKQPRQRTQSENIQFTFISFIERNLERKQSGKIE